LLKDKAKIQQWTRYYTEK